MQSAIIRQELDRVALDYGEERHHNEAGIIWAHQISEAPAALLDRVGKRTQWPGDDNRSETYLDQVFEEDIVYRLESAGLLINRHSDTVESSQDDRLVGRIFGILDGELLHVYPCSEAAFEAVSKKSRLPEPVFQEVQLLLYLAGLDHSKVIAVSKEKGRIFVVHLPRKKGVGEGLEEKALFVLGQVEA